MFLKMKENENQRESKKEAEMDYLTGHLCYLVIGINVWNVVKIIIKCKKYRVSLIFYLAKMQ